MASQFGCKLCSAYRCINPQASLPPKSAPIVPPPHSHPPSTSGARLLHWLACFVIVMRPSQGQRCQQYDSHTHTHTHFACWSLSLSKMFLYTIPPTFHQTPLLFSSNSIREKKILQSFWMRWGSPSCLSPFLPPAFTAFFPPLSPQRNSPSFGLSISSHEHWDSSWLWVPERGRESITPIQHSAWNCKVTVETAVFVGAKGVPAWK